jgi:hypothetical protein
MLQVLDRMKNRHHHMRKYETKIDSQYISKRREKKKVMHQENTSPRDGNTINFIKQRLL